MPLVVVDEGEVLLLDHTLRKENGFQSFKIWFFANDYTPAANSVRANFVPTTAAGLEPVALARATWSQPTTVGGRAQSRYGAAPLSFTPTADSQELLFGYFITDYAGLVCVWAERWPLASAIVAGTPITVWPILTGRSEYSPA
jgi:hypothetical protein